MSSFNGIVVEFPRIRIDYFRLHEGQQPPLAGFLSHIHSDHLVGLDTLKSPFIYCSHATRQLLLRLEKWPHRINFNNGILEARKQTYKHLKTVLRPIPLHVPTEIELTPSYKIRVTLFDANHCPGAVMFLIEGQGKAVLYSGDVRAEPWFVNALTRQPVMVPYTFGKTRLDKIYLDTTFAVTDRVYDKFPSKAEGLRELLEAVMAYPDDTVFYFKAWTVGYEEVWAALAAALNSQVHVDRYFWDLFKELSKPFDNGIGIAEAPYLHGFKFGNTYQKGCLTSDAFSARIHSCDSGDSCEGLKGRKVVNITPIITKDRQGRVVAEAGAGGGFGDLIQDRLELLDHRSVEMLRTIISKEVQDSNTLNKVHAILSMVFRSKDKTIKLQEFASLGEDQKQRIDLNQVIQVLTSREAEEEVEAMMHDRGTEPDGMTSSGPSKPEPRAEILFPYSRHSSYSELCGLVGAFRPKDLYACSVDESWDASVSMRSLFGHLCSGDTFLHDRQMYAWLELESRRIGAPAVRKRRRDQSPDVDDNHITQETQRSAREEEKEKEAPPVEPPSDDPETVDMLSCNHHHYHDRHNSSKTVDHHQSVNGPDQSQRKRLRQRPSPSPSLPVDSEKKEEEEERKVMTTAEPDFDLVPNPEKTLDMLRKAWERSGN